MPHQFRSIPWGRNGGVLLQRVLGAAVKPRADIILSREDNGHAVVEDSEALAGPSGEYGVRVQGAIGT